MPAIPRQRFAAAPIRIEADAASPLASITYKAYGPLNSEFEIELEYSTDNGRTFSSALPDNPLDAYCVATSPYGEEGFMEWEYVGDLRSHGHPGGEVLVRLRLVDGDTLKSSWTSVTFRTPRVAR